MRASSPRHESIQAATEAWARAFNAHDLATLTGLYDPQAVLWGTLSAELVTSADGVRGYFERAFASSPGLAVGLGEARVRSFGATAVSSGLYCFTMEAGGQGRQLPARFSFVYRHRAGAWRIVDHHSSLLPASP